MRSPSQQDSRYRANARAAQWKASEQAFFDRLREQNREAWRDYHLRQAEYVLEVARALSEEHRAAAAALAQEGHEDG